MHQMEARGVVDGVGIPNSVGPLHGPEQLTIEIEPWQAALDVDPKFLSERCPSTRSAHLAIASVATYSSFVSLGCSDLTRSVSPEYIQTQLCHPFFPDGSLLASASWDKTIRLWIYTYRVAAPDALSPAMPVRIGPPYLRTVSDGI